MDAHTEAEILQTCLAQIESGRASLADCLARYPEIAAELEPMLRAATQLRALAQAAQSELPPNTVAAGQRRLASAWAARHHRRPSPAARRGSDSDRRGLLAIPRWAAALAALALALALGVGTVAASGDSLPGEPLYGVKRATERVQLALSPAGARPALQTRFASQRLDEFSTLARRGEVEETTLAEMQSATEAALEGAEGLSEAEKEAVLTQLAELTERQQSVLAEVLAKAPEAAQTGLQRAIEASQHGHQRAMQALSSQKETGPPDHAHEATETAAPGGETASASETPEPTRSHGPPPEVTHGPKPTPPDQSNIPPGQARQTEKAATLGPSSATDQAHTPPGQAKKATETGGSSHRP